MTQNLNNAHEVLLGVSDFDAMLKDLMSQYRILAPVRLHGRGRFSDQDSIRYGEITSVRQIVYSERSHFSPKETVFPVTQTMYYLTEDNMQEPSVDQRGILLFLRACDINGFHRMDNIFLRNGNVPDPYYGQLREKVKFVLLECRESYPECFCVSTGTNRTDDFAMAVRFDDDTVLAQIRDETLIDALPVRAEPKTFTPEFPLSNPTTVELPDAQALQKAIRDHDFINHPMWAEYTKRCIACGRCNTHCVTCTCFTSYDIQYDDSSPVGERRRAWAGCHIDKFTDMAGGHKFREDNGARMRFKAMHKIYDYALRFGSRMCVGCGRCDTHCPEYISFAACINSVSRVLREENLG